MLNNYPFYLYHVYVHQYGAINLVVFANQTMLIAYLMYKAIHTVNNSAISKTTCSWSSVCTYIYHIIWSSLTAVSSYGNLHTETLHLKFTHAHPHTHTYTHTYIFDICKGWQVYFNPFTTVDAIWHLDVIIHPQINLSIQCNFYCACCHPVCS